MITPHVLTDKLLHLLRRNRYFWSQNGLLLPPAVLPAGHVFRYPYVMKIIADAIEIDTYGYPLIQRWSSPGLYGRLNPEGRKQYADCMLF